MLFISRSIRFFSSVWSADHMLALSAFHSLKYLNSRDLANRMFSVLVTRLIKFFSAGNTVPGREERGENGFETSSSERDRVCWRTACSPVDGVFF
jgi:hypothetical protein